MEEQNRRYLTVSEVNRYISYKFETDMALQQIYVEGELSNVKKSGAHYYFSLKDANSEISCMFFYPGNLSLSFVPKDGDKVEVVGKIGVYQKRGTYSINISKMNLCGIGALYEQYLALKKKLETEGLFDESHKLKIPEYPKCVGIITASTGEAINDIISTFNRRLPLAKLKLFPCLVQGMDAPKDLIRALNLAYEDSELDCIIIGRGGGSFEDLNAFNDESLARLLYKSKIPTISAVGHEGDYTICDFVCSFRAPTPTGAAMKLTKVKEEVLELIYNNIQRLKNAVVNKIKIEIKNYDNLNANLKLLSPELIEKRKEEELDNLINKLSSNFKLNYNDFYNKYNLAYSNLRIDLINNIIKEKEDKFNHLVEKASLLNPLNVIKKGYSIVYKNKEVITSTKNLNVGDVVDLKFAEGNASATIKNID